MPEDPQYINNLFLQVGEGNEPAFRKIFNLYKERFYCTSLKMTYSGHMAEEIVQKVFISLWIKRNQVASAENPEGYLFTMLNNSIYAHFRKLAAEKAMKKKVGQQSEYVDPSPVEDTLFGRENSKMLETVINRLPPQQRTVFILSRQQGLSRLEIAGQLHISPNTVKNHLREAVRFVRACYEAGASAIIFIAILKFF